MKSISFVPVFVLAACLVSCDPQSVDDTVYSNCKITRMYSQGDTSQTSSYYYYNNQQLVHVDMPGPVDQYITYNGNVVTVGWGIEETRFYLRPDSMAYGSARYSQGSFIDTIIYQYDTGGHLVKEVCYSTLFGKDSTFMTYANGDMTSYRWYSSNGHLTYGDFTYHSTVSKHWFYNNMGPTGNNRSYYPWLGKPNAHLIKSYTSNFNGADITDNLTYTLNASGYVSSYTGAGTTGTYKNFIEYQCN